MNIFFKMMIMITFLTVSSIADIWRIEGGAGLWTGSADGTITGIVDDGSVTVTDNLGDHEDQTAGYIYVVVKHPVPIVPNVRFEYTGVKARGTDVKGESNGITIDGVANSQLFLTQYDTVLFYNLVDNTFWMTFDLGVDLKYVVSQYVIDTKVFLIPTQNIVDETSSSIVPMAYVRGRVELPTLPLGFETDVKYITDGESTVYDIRLKVDYTLKMDAAIEPGIELGYRVQKFKVDGEESNLLGDVFSGQSNTEVTFSGLYGGITVKFQVYVMANSHPYNGYQ